MSNSLLSLCDRHRAVEERQNQLHGLLGDVEVALADHHAWFELTRVQRRALPAAQIMYDMEDELEQLQRESADLVLALQSLSAISLAEATAKLDVVARVIDPDDYPYAHAVLVSTIADLSALLQRCSLPGTQ
jgi:hypothetical protein